MLEQNEEAPVVDDDILPVFISQVVSDIKDDRARNILNFHLHIEISRYLIKEIALKEAEALHKECESLISDLKDLMAFLKQHKNETDFSGTPVFMCCLDMLQEEEGLMTDALLVVYNQDWKPSFSESSVESTKKIKHDPSEEPIHNKRSKKTTDTECSDDEEYRYGSPAYFFSSRHDEASNPLGIGSSSGLSKNPGKS